MPQLFVDALDHLAHVSHLIDAGLLFIEAPNYLEIGFAVDQGPEILLGEELAEHVSDPLVAVQFDHDLLVDDALQF